MDPEILALLEQVGISPEDFQAMADAGVFDEMAGALGPQMERAQGMADAPMDTGRMVSGYYVPPSMLSTLSQGVGKGLGAYGLKKSQDKQQGLIDALRKGNMAAGKAGMRDRLGFPGGDGPPGPVSAPWDAEEEDDAELARIVAFLTGRGG